MKDNSRGVVLRNNGKRGAKPRGIQIEAQPNSMRNTQSINSPTDTALFCSTGKFGKTLPRPVKKKHVDHERGGSDFRCPHSISSFTFQMTSRPHTSNDPVPRFTKARRFHPKPSTPGYSLGHTSSVGKQSLSQNLNNKGFGFGTSTRECALKQYNISTAKQNP